MSTVPPEGPYERIPVGGDRPLRVVIEQGGFFGRWRTRLPWILFFFALLFALGVYSQYESYRQLDPRIDEKFVSHEILAADKVAIITIEGTILHNDGFAKWQIDRVRDDKNVKAVVVRVDSPGGTVTGSDYIYHHLKQLRQQRDIPLVVSMGGVAASGGYYVAMAAGDTPDTIFAERSTWTGSIGVIIPHYNFADLLESWKIDDDSVMSGPLKALGSPTRKLSPELAAKERAILQGLVDQTFEQFKEVVAEARPKLAADKEAFTQATTGQVFTAKQALDLGLVDKLGYQEEAVNRAIELARLDPNKVRVVKYKRPESLLGSALFGGGSADSGRLNPAALLDLTAPRAYYLYTLIPSLIRTGE